MLNDLAKSIYEANKEKGFWDKERNVGEMLMLVTSELGEAMEAHRKNRFANWANASEDFENSIKDTFEDEIADAIIRLLDMCGGLGIEIESHVFEKLKYNATRPRLHGKLY
jgi:NTP pyrophosphatase (non-canonical NTP hydrolase)